jgi:transposase
MVKLRARKTEKGLIPQCIFEEAAKKVLNKGKSIRRVADDYGMCHVTLSRYINKQRDNLVPKVGYNPHNKVFSVKHEQVLVEYCKTSAKLYYGLTTKDLRKLAYQFAVQNDLKFHEKWNETELASEDWLTAFLRRNPQLSLRTPQATSLARAMNFNRANVDKFFDNLSTVMDRYRFEPQNIYNVDETGLTTVQKPSKIIAEKGTKQVGSITSQERGTLVTMCLAVNAIGNAFVRIGLCSMCYASRRHLSNGRNPPFL